MVELIWNSPHAAPQILVTKKHVIDDPDDDSLPITQGSTESFWSVDENGDATDMTGQEQVVQDIAAVVWA